MEEEKSRRARARARERERERKNACEFADLQQRKGRIMCPRGVVHNNHRCLSPGAEGALEVRSRYPPRAFRSGYFLSFTALRTVFVCAREVLVAPG